GDDRIEVRREPDRAPLLRFRPDDLETLPEEVNVVPVAERVLESLLPVDPVLEPLHAQRREILGEVPRPLDPDAVAVKPPVVRVLGGRKELLLELAPVGLEPRGRPVP